MNPFKKEVQFDSSLLELKTPRLRQRVAAESKNLLEAQATKKFLTDLFKILFKGKNAALVKTLTFAELYTEIETKIKELSTLDSLPENIHPELIICDFSTEGGQRGHGCFNNSGYAEIKIKLHDEWGVYLYIEVTNGKPGEKSEGPESNYHYVHVLLARCRRN